MLLSGPEQPVGHGPCRDAAFAPGGGYGAARALAPPRAGAREPQRDSGLAAQPSSLSSPGEQRTGVVASESADSAAAAAGAQVPEGPYLRGARAGPEQPERP